MAGPGDARTARGGVLLACGQSRRAACAGPAGNVLTCRRGHLPQHGDGDPKLGVVAGGASAGAAGDYGTSYDYDALGVSQVIAPDGRVITLQKDRRGRTRFET